MFGIKNEKWYIKLTLALLTTLFFLVCTYTVIRYGNYFLLGSMEKYDNDDVKYIRSAITLLDKGLLTYHDVNAPTAFITPGLPFSLALFFKIFGVSAGLTAFRIYQALLQSLCVYLIFLTGREIFGSALGIIASAISFFYIADISGSGMILTEVQFKFLLVLLVYISLIAVKTKKTGLYIAGGVLWGTACLFRPVIALFPSVILVMWIIYRYTFKEILKYSLIVVAVFSVIMAPWWIRNYLVFDRFIPLTLSTGNPFLQGTYIEYDQTEDYTPYTPVEDAIENNRIEMETGIYRLKTYFKKHPFEYIYWYTLGKSRYLWNYPFYMKEVLGFPFELAELYHHLILLLGIIGIVISFRKKNVGGVYLMLVILYFNLSYLLYFTYSRYSYPIMPFMILLAGFGAKSLLSRQAFDKLFYRSCDK